MPLPENLAHSSHSRRTALLRNTGANGGTLFLAAGGTFTGSAVGVSVGATAALTNVLSHADAPIYAQTSGGTITLATSLTLAAGLTFGRFTRFTSDVAAIVYLDGPLTLS